MRNHFAQELTRSASQKSEIFLVYGDIGNKLFDSYKEHHPGRFVNAGIAEASMISMAAGMARYGLVPVVYTINPFIYLKALEQIKLDVCYPNLPVIMVGTGGALAYSELGTTHHSLEDVGVLSNLPNLRIYVPADEQELSMCFAEALTEGTPAYIRIGKKEVEKVHDAQPNFQSTNHGLIPIRVSNNSEILLVSYGTISTEVFHAWQVLRKDTEIDFWTLPRLKPNEISEITKLITTYRVIVAVEEHRSTGGMTALLLEAASLSGAPRPELVFINSGDKFHTGLGNQNQARKSLGLDSDSIVRKVRSLV